MDRNSPPHDSTPSGPGSGVEESAAGDSELARRIWSRYGSSPGVIPTAVTLGLATRLSRWSSGRLPLVAEVYRRWTPADASFTADWPAPTDAWPPVFAGARPPSVEAVVRAPEIPPHQAGLSSPMPRASQASSERAAAARPEKAIQPKPPPGAQASRRRVGPPISVSASERQPIAHKVQRMTEARTPAPPGAPAGSLGAGLVGGTIQRATASPDPARVDSLMTGGGGEAVSARSPYPPFSPAGGKDKGEKGPTAYAGQRTVFRHEPAHLDKGAPLSLPAISRSRTRSEAGQPLITSAQRYVSSPAWGAIQRAVVSPVPARVDSPMPAGGKEAGSPSGGEGNRERSPTAHVVQRAVSLREPAHVEKGVPLSSPAMELLRTADHGAEPVGGAVRFGPASVRAPLEMPLARATASLPAAPIALLQTKPETPTGATPAAPPVPSPMELPEVPAPETPSEVDVTRLAEQVYEILVRRLASERERRGL